MSPLDVEEHLRSEIATADPWRLASSPFEQRRYAIMLDMIRNHGRFQRGLEVGCAAGVFTELLAPHCQTLHVVDTMPQALARMLQRTQSNHNITCEAVSVTEDFAAGETFDLIVVAEILYYLPSAKSLSQAIENLARRLRPGGLLIFGSALDETCDRWGLKCGGAETAMHLWEAALNETGRVTCRGSYWGENCCIVSYSRAAATSGDGAPSSHGIQEHNLIPFRAATDIPAGSVVVLAPHPDDEVIGCGGAILRHVKTGTPVRVFVATPDAVHQDAHLEDTLSRQAECLAAARMLGYGVPTFWNFADRKLAYDEPLIRKVLRSFGDADLVYAPSPWEAHPDHRALGMAVLEAARRAGGDLRVAFYEVSTPLRPNLLLDISEFQARKQAAIRCFASQLEKRSYDRFSAALNEYRAYTLPRGITAAEAYLVVSADALQRDPLIIHQPEIEQRFAQASRALHDAENRILQIQTTARERLSIVVDQVRAQTTEKVQAQTAEKVEAEMTAKFEKRLAQQRAQMEARMIHARDVEREQCRAAIAHVERALAVTRNSTSWRMTAPLRAVAGVFKRVLRFAASAQ